MVLNFLNVLDVTSRMDLSGVVRAKTSTHRHTEKLAWGELGSLMEKLQPPKSLACFLYMNPKCIWVYKITRIAKEILEKKNNARVITIPDFILYCKQLQYRTDTKETRWSKEYIIDDPESQQHSYTHLSFDTGIKRHWRKRQPLTNCSRETEFPNIKGWN